MVWVVKIVVPVDKIVEVTSTVLVSVAWIVFVRVFVMSISETEVERIVEVNRLVEVTVLLMRLVDVAILLF